MGQVLFFRRKNERPVPSAPQPEEQRRSTPAPSPGLTIDLGFSQHGDAEVRALRRQLNLWVDDQLWLMGPAS